MAYMYISVCADKQWQLFYCLTEIHVISLKVKKPFPWYYCFDLAISQHCVNQITWPRGCPCSQRYVLFITPPKLSAILTVFGGVLCAPLLRLVWKWFLESLYICGTRSAGFESVLGADSSCFKAWMCAREYCSSDSICQAKGGFPSKVWHVQGHQVILTIPVVQLISGLWCESHV